MIHYDDYALQLIEREICDIYHNDLTGYPDCASLLEIRRQLLNEQALTYESQEELLPLIIAFNDALRDALKRMYDRAHELYRHMSAIQPDIELSAKCYLGDYPVLHPYQAEDRQDLFSAICDFGWNPLYDSGVCLSLDFPRDKNKSFESFVSLVEPSSNWNEGLNHELTKDLQLIHAFHNLFDHTRFALTDFIYVRDFFFEFSTISQETLKI